MYEDRLVAFLDIIGWSTACGSVDSDELARVEKAARLLSEISNDYSELAHASLDAWAQKHPGSRINPMRRHVRKSVFSDNYVVSMPADFGLRIAVDVAHTAVQLQKLGFLSRGGIAMGSMYHSDGVAFGPALVDAVALEKEAHLPRVLCAPNVVEFINSGPLGGTHPIIQDPLGRWIANLYDLRAHFPDGETLEMHRQMYEADLLETIFAKGSAVNAAVPSRLEKWTYAADSLNAGLRRIEALGATSDAAPSTNGKQ
jgi:hypothetical protein